MSFSSILASHPLNLRIHECAAGAEAAEQTCFEEDLETAVVAEESHEAETRAVLAVKQTTVAAVRDQQLQRVGAIVLRCQDTTK